jgi:hypothetical protein
VFVVCANVRTVGTSILRLIIHVTAGLYVQRVVVCHVLVMAIAHVMALVIAKLVGSGMIVHVAMLYVQSD